MIKSRSLDELLLFLHCDENNMVCTVCYEILINDIYANLIFEKIMTTFLQR